MWKENDAPDIPKPKFTPPPQNLYKICNVKNFEHRTSTHNSVYSFEEDDIQC